jgi:uncharacterized protein
MKTHPCLRCGACCAYFRVSFHWTETSNESHGVPVQLTNWLTPHQNSMNGTTQANPKCVALLGVVGQATSCKIYDNRPSPCRSFKPSYEDGVRNVNCEKARTSKGLISLTSADWPVSEI